MNDLINQPMAKFAREVESLIGVKLSASQIKAFQIYENELIEWNKIINLTAIRDVSQIRCKHFLDSLSCWLAFGDRKPKSIIDIGSGAGFPGIPLKILLPKMQLTLVESIGKKAKFCEHIVQTLRLENVTVITARAEEVGKTEIHRENYDWAVARAVAALPILVEFLLPFTRLNGGVIAQKGGNAPAEVQQAQNAIRVLGGRLHQLIPVSIPGVVEERYLVVINKVAPTPSIYPRLTGTPTKKPLL